MGITRDQEAMGAFRRMRHHYEALREEQEQWTPGQDALIQAEMHAWAFARIVVENENVRALVHHMGWCFETGQSELNFWENCFDAEGEHLTDPIEVLETLVRGYILIRSMDTRGYLGAFYDASTMIEDWDLRKKAEGAMLWVNREQAESWGTRDAASWTWVGIHEFLDELVRKRRSVDERHRPLRDL